MLSTEGARSVRRLRPRLEVGVEVRGSGEEEADCVVGAGEGE